MDCSFSDKSRSAARLFFSPNANALVTVFWLSGIAVEVFRLCLPSRENLAFWWIILMPALLIVVPGAIAASAGVISRKRSPVGWGLLTAAMLAGWSAALAGRETHGSYAATFAAFLTVFLIAATASVIAEKSGAVLWGLLTAAMLAFWSTALVVREYGWNGPQFGTFGGVFVLTSTPSVIGVIIAERRRQ